MARAYALQVIIAADQTVNAILGGWADETFSSRCYRWKLKKSRLRVFYYAVNALFFWQADHCQDAFLSERNSRHLPPELRKKV